MMKMLVLGGFLVLVIVSMNGALCARLTDVCEVFGYSSDF
jgi:hypothetical protein